MGWKSFLFGFAALVACGFGAWADGVVRAENDARNVTEVQLPQRDAAPVPLRSASGLPRYATMTPPPAEEMPPAPAAAPSPKITTAPLDPAAALAQGRSVSVAPAAVAVSGGPQYHLGPGDKLHITVFNEADLTGDFSIDGQGFLRLPLVGQVQAAGLTSSVLETRIAGAFVGGGYLLNPRVAVEIVGYRPFYIIGEVAKPGEYPYVNAMTVPNAIALAGGYTDRAVQSTVWVRGQNDAKEREYRADESTRIQPGDVVRVERSTYWAVMTVLAPLISPFTSAAYILK